MSNGALLGTALSVQEKITRAKVEMLKRPPNGRPYWSYLAVHMECRPDTDIDTAGIKRNSRYIYYNPEWLGALTGPEICSVICHEIQHAAFMHPERRMGRDLERWNVACDLWINAVLVKDRFQLPKCGLIPNNDTFTLKDGSTIDRLSERCAEEIYALLPTDGNETGEGFDDHEAWEESDGAAGSGDETSEGGTPNGPQTGLDWPHLMAQAVQHAKQQGSVPAGADRWVDAVSGRLLDWRSLLQSTIVALVPYDYTFTRQSRRSATAGVYLPSVRRESLEMEFIFDSSGSMTERDLAEAKGLSLDVIQLYPSAHLFITVCDAEVTQTFELTAETADQWRSMAIKGGGGTDFRPAIAKAIEERPQLKLIAYFTDGFGTFPEKEPPCQTVWLLQPPHCDQDKVPFGRVLPLERYPLPGGGDVST